MASCHCDLLTTNFTKARNLHKPSKAWKRLWKFWKTYFKDLMRTRDRLKKLAVRSKSPLQMDSYRQVRNKVNTLNIQLKKLYYNNKISASEGNMKNSWTTINELLNKRSKSSNINKKVINKTKAIFHFRPIELQETRDAFAKVKTAKSFGIDNISSYFLKLALPSIENALALMFKTSIETSLFPDAWKVSRVTPIFKDGDRAEKSNCRPISVLPVNSRLFEKLITNQLYHHMYDNGLFSSGQSAYLSLHSTVTHLLKNTDNLYIGLDLGKLVGLVSIDLKMAFDTVDHDIFCQKLVHYGAQQRELAWFRSYLYNRKQFCCVNGVNSKIEDIDVGVPQDSCLGPLLFLIYINDLPQAVQNSVVSMYADDTSLCYQSPDMTQVNEAMNSDLKQLDSWLQGNKLSLNVAKTHSLLVSTKQKHKIIKNRKEDLELKIRDNELEVVQKTKYLGVKIDSSLDWKEHIKSVSTKISRAIGFLKHAKSFLPLESLKTLYTGIVEPHFRYCCSVWGCAAIN